MQLSLLRINNEEMKELGQVQPHQGIKRGYRNRPSSQVAYQSMNRFAPSLLRLNKSIHEEVSKLLYSRHTFNFDHPATIFLFCMVIGERNLRLLRSVRLRAWSGYRQGCGWNHAAMSALSRATNLEHICFGKTRYWGTGWSRNSKEAGRYLYNLLAPFLQPLGLSCGRIDAVIDMIEFPRIRANMWDGQPSKDQEVEEKTEVEKSEDEAVKAELRSLVLSR